MTEYYSVEEVQNLASHEFYAAQKRQLADFELTKIVRELAGN